MLRSIFRRTVIKNLPTIPSAECSTRSSITGRKYINRVTLIGSIVGDRFKNDRVTKYFNIRTTSDDGKRDKIHQLYTATPANLEDGQRVFIGGSLSSRETLTPDNKKRHQPIIQALHIVALDSFTEDETKTKDLNSIELLGTVCGHVINKDDHSIVRVVTHYMNQSTQEIRPNFHSVFIFNQNLCGIVRKNVEKYDRIFMAGFLSEYEHTDANGMKSSNQFIIAESIDKLIKFNRNQSTQQKLDELQV